MALRQAVGGDRVEPAARRAAPVELRAAAPGLQQRLLDEIVGLVQRAHHPVAMQLQLAAVGRRQALEGRPIEDRPACRAQRLKRAGSVCHVEPAVWSLSLILRASCRRRKAAAADREGGALRLAAGERDHGASDIGGVCTSLMLARKSAGLMPR